MDYNINDPTAYVIYSIYLIPLFPYFVMLNWVEKPTLALGTYICKRTYHIYFILLEVVYLDNEL